MEGLTVGQRLRERREAKGLTLEEAVALTKIQPSFLRALEEEDYRFLPDELYLLGFLSSYAIFLGLDPQEVTALFREQVRRRGKRGFTLAPPKLYTFSVRKALLPLTVLLVLIPFLFIGLSLFQGPEVPGGKPRPIESPVRGGLTGPPPLQGLPLPPEGPSQHTLTARAKEPTWMAVDIDGEEEHEVLLKSGEVARWTARERFVLTIGNAGGIGLELDGVPLPPLGVSGQVIRRLVLPRE